MTTDNTDRYFGKLAVLSQALLTVSDLEPESLLSPYESHWYPPSREAPGRKGSTNFRARRAGHPMIATTLLPLPPSEQPVKGDEIDAWDFVLRNAFILGNSPIKKALA